LQGLIYTDFDPALRQDDKTENETLDLMEYYSRAVLKEMLGSTKHRPVLMSAMNDIVHALVLVLARNIVLVMDYLPKRKNVRTRTVGSITTMNAAAITFGQTSLAHAALREGAKGVRALVDGSEYPTFIDREAVAEVMADIMGEELRPTPGAITFAAAALEHVMFYILEHAPHVTPSALYKTITRDPELNLIFNIMWNSNISP
jgi:hypothetical protein